MVAKVILLKHVLLRESPIFLPGANAEDLTVNYKVLDDVPPSTITIQILPSVPLPFLHLASAKPVPHLTGPFYLLFILL